MQLVHSIYPWVGEKLAWFPHQVLLVFQLKLDVICQLQNMLALAFADIYPFLTLSAYACRCQKVSFPHCLKLLAVGWERKRSAPHQHQKHMVTAHGKHTRWFTWLMEATFVEIRSWVKEIRFHDWRRDFNMKWCFVVHQKINMKGRIMKPGSLQPTQCTKKTTYSSILVHLLLFSPCGIVQLLYTEANLGSICEVS